MKTTKTVSITYRVDLALFLTVPLAYVTDNWFIDALAWTNVAIATVLSGVLATILIIKGNEFVKTIKSLGKVTTRMSKFSWHGLLMNVAVLGMLYYCGWEVAAVIIGACYVILHSLIRQARS